MESVNDLALIGRMKRWIEEIDHEACGFPSLEEALEDIYQDEGYTISLYRELKKILLCPPSEILAYNEIFRMYQEWFEAIDYKSSDYRSLEEALKDIYQDEGESLALYKKLIIRNANKVGG